MGEIGIPRLEYLYELTHCDLLMIGRGYDRRHRDLWSSSRWQTYNLMQAFCGGKAMNEAGIYKPTDLIKFPWDTAPVAPISQEEAADLQAEMAAINAANNVVNPQQ